MLRCGYIEHQTGGILVLALDSRIRRLALEGMLVSYDSVVSHRIHQQIFEEVVPSALKYYDLPDLIGGLAPRPVWIVNPVNGLGHPVPAAESASHRAFLPPPPEESAVTARSR